MSLLTLREAGARLGLSGVDIMMLVEAGRLPVEVRLGRLVFRDHELDRMAGEFESLGKKSA